VLKFISHRQFVLSGILVHDVSHKHFFVSFDTSISLYPSISLYQSTVVR